MNELEQKLFIDLCSRLPYDVKVLEDLDGNFDGGAIGTLKRYIGMKNGVPYFLTENTFTPLSIKEIRPYLRPISSMNDEEINKLFDILHINKEGHEHDWVKINDVLGIKFFFTDGQWVEDVDKALNYLRSIHIDINDLISEKMAIESLSDMYK